VLPVIDSPHILKNKEIQVELLVKCSENTGEATGQVFARIIASGPVTIGKRLARWPADYTSQFRIAPPLIHQSNELVCADF
jgi:hypothetical protein